MHMYNCWFNSWKLFILSLGQLMFFVWIMLIINDDLQDDITLFMATLVPRHFYFIFLLSLFPNVRKFQVTAFITTSTIPNLYKYKWFVALSIMQTSQWSCHKHKVYVAGFIRFHIVCMVHTDRDFFNTHCEVLQLNLAQRRHRVFQWVCH